MKARSRRLIAVSLVALAAGAGTLFGWTAESVVRMADLSLQVTPPHLVGQIEKHQKQLHAGIRAAAKSDPTVAADGSLTGVTISPRSILGAEIDRAVARIVDHEPFSQIVFQLGVVSYWVAALNDPLLASASSGSPPTYSSDYRAYLDSARTRFSVLYYPFGRQVASKAELDDLLARTRRRSTVFAPVIATEYRRIGGNNGRTLFDDKSTAFGIGSLAFSHGVSDIAAVLRYIWLRAGGADTLGLPALGPDHLILISSGSEDP